MLHSSKWHNKQYHLDSFQSIMGRISKKSFLLTLSVKKFSVLHKLYFWLLCQMQPFNPVSHDIVKKIKIQNK